MRLRISISVAIGAATGVMCWLVLARLNQGAADFTWALRLARSLLARANPYDTPLEQYPVTAALFALPFVRMVPDQAAGLFFGISSGLLAFGLSRGGYHRLLVEVWGRDQRKHITFAHLAADINVACADITRGAGKDVCLFIPQNRPGPRHIQHPAAFPDCADPDAWDKIPVLLRGANSLVVLVIVRPRAIGEHSGEQQKRCPPE